MEREGKGGTATKQVERFQVQLEHFTECILNDRSAHAHPRRRLGQHGAAGRAPTGGARGQASRDRLIDAITGSSVNDYEGADLHCQGRGTVVRGNVGHQDRPYQSGETAGTVVQSYETELTERCIAERMR